MKYEALSDYKKEAHTMPKTIERERPATLVLIPHAASGEPYTTSEIVAEFAGVQRHAIQQIITTYESDFKDLGKLAFEMRPSPDSKTGQSIKLYHLNEPQATLLMTYLKNTEQVRAFKKELVRQFYDMRSLLLERASPIWQDTRSLGKEIRRMETDAIKALVDYTTAQGSQNANRYYMVHTLDGLHPVWIRSGPESGEGRGQSKGTGGPPPGAGAGDGRAGVWSSHGSLRTEQERRPIC